MNPLQEHAQCADADDNAGATGLVGAAAMSTLIPRSQIQAARVVAPDPAGIRCTALCPESKRVIYLFPKRRSRTVDFIRLQTKLTELRGAGLPLN